MGLPFLRMTGLLSYVPFAEKIDFESYGTTRTNCEPRKFESAERWGNSSILANLCSFNLLLRSLRFPANCQKCQEASSACTRQILHEMANLSTKWFPYARV